MRRLRRAWADAVAGSGSLVLLSGEPGVGKSRLGQELLREAAAGGGLALYGCAYAREDQFLYQPLIDPLRRALQLAEQHGLKTGAPIWLGQLGRLLPELRGDAGAPPTPSEERGRWSSANPREPPLEETRSRWHLMDAVTQLLLALSRQRALCLFLDDLHWADAATGECWDYLCHRARQGRALLIGAYREGDPSGNPWLQRWLTETLGQRLALPITLGRLGPDDARRLVWRLTGERIPASHRESLGRQVYEQTEGNPLFLVETVRALMADHRWATGGPPVVGSDPGDYRWATGGPPVVFPIPLTIQRAVQQRVAQLSEEDQELLGHAAVVGRRFRFDGLRRATGWSHEQMLCSLERLLAAGLIHARAEGDGFDFSHERLREVVYESLSSERRQELHRRVAEALEEVYGLGEEALGELSPHPAWYLLRLAHPVWVRGEEQAAELARHFHAAGGLVGPEKAARYYYLAGRRARRLNAYERAVDDLTTALSLAEEMPPGPARQLRVNQIVEELAPAYRGTGRPRAALDVVRRYLASCQEQQDVRGMARGSLLMGIFLRYNVNFEGPETSRAMFEQAIALCEAHDLRDWLPYPQCSLALVLAEMQQDLPRAEALAAACRLSVEARAEPALQRLLHTVLIWLAIRRRDEEAMLGAFRDALLRGGPLPHPFQTMLAEAEETYHAAGAEARFRQLCREIAVAYRDAGIEAPLEQWFLEETIGRGIADCRLMIDDWGEGFLQSAISNQQSAIPGMTWQGAVEYTSIDCQTRPGWLGLSPPAEFDLWPEADLNAPRLMTVAPRDFVAETQVDLADATGVLAGLLLWQDEQQFARLELRSYLREPAAVYLEACVGGRFRLIGRGRCERRPIRLRLEREGDRVRGLCSADGKTWLTCGSLRFPNQGEARVGIAAITQVADGRAWFRGFRLWSLGE